MSALDVRIDSPADIGPNSTLATRALHHQTARCSLLGLFLVLQLIHMTGGARVSRPTFWRHTCCSRIRSSPLSAPMAVEICSIRTGRRARIFEIHPRPFCVSIDVHAPAGHKAFTAATVHEDCMD